MHLPFEHNVESLVKKIKGKTGVHLEPPLVFGIGLVVLFLLLAGFPTLSLSAFGIALFLAPLWLPVLIVSAAWYMWVTLKRSEFIHDIDYILLEIKPPRNLDKTPLAMEIVLSGLHLNPNESNWYKKYIQGGVRPYWSLELASIEGQVHFFIWTRASLRRTVETHIYAQYPGAQVVEAPDYTRTISADPKEWEIFGCDYKHTREDALPIKTYVDYGLDKTQKEPEQVDPLANLIEFLGAFGKNEYFWLQFIIRVHMGDKWPGKKNKIGKQYTWRDEAREKIEEIREEARFGATFTDPVSGEERETQGFPLQTKGQLEMIAAIEHNVAKLGFDVGIRALYIGKKGAFDPATIASMKGLFNAFSSQTHNDITWNGSRGLLRFEDYPWEWNLPARKAHEREHLVEAFRRRQFFHAPYSWSDYMTMSTEELATLFHIPSHAITTPGLPRITSATSEAPSNLPL